MTLLPPDIAPHSDSVQSAYPFTSHTLITLYHLSPPFLSCIWVSVSELLTLPFCLLFLFPTTIHSLIDEVELTDTTVLVCPGHWKHLSEHVGHGSWRNMSC